jgi:hypothetical protein
MSLSSNELLKSVFVSKVVLFSYSPYLSICPKQEASSLINYLCGAAAVYADSE